MGDTVTLNASGTLDRQGVIHITPISVVSEMTNATATGSIDLEQDVFALTLAANYDNLARVLPSLPQELSLPLLIETKLQGPFAAPEIFLHTMLADTEVMAGSLQLGLDTIFSVRGNLHVMPPLVLQTITGLQPEDVADITLDVSYAEDTGVLQITQLNMAGMGVDASLQGTMKPETPSLDLQLAVAAENLMPLSVLLPTSLKGGVAGSLTVKATEDHLTAEATTNLHGFQLDQLQLTEGHIEIGTQWDHWFSAAPKNILAQINASTVGLQYPALKPMNMTLETCITGAALEELKINSLSLSDGNITVAGDGQIAIASMTGNVNLETSIADLSLLPVEMAGLPKGALQLQTQLQGGVNPLVLNMDVAGTVKDIDNIPSPLVALLGEIISFDAKTVLSDHDVKIREAQVQGAGLNISGKTAYDWKTKNLKSEIETSLPRLVAIGSAINKPVTGAVEITASTEGTLPKLTINAQVKGHGLTYNKMPPVETLLDIAATDVPEQMKAVITGRADSEGASISLNTQVALEDENVVIDPFAVTSGANNISGQASWPLKDGFPQMQLEATLDNLNALAALAGLDISGAAKASVKIQQDNTKITAEAHALHYGDVSIEKVILGGNATKLFSMPVGMFSFDVHNLESGFAVVNHFAVHGDGTKNDMALTSSLAGNLMGGADAPQPLLCETSTYILFTERRVTVERVEGTLGAFPFSLENAAEAALSKKGFYLEPLLFHIGKGIIHAEARNEADEIQGIFRSENIPLALSSLFVTPSATGTLDGTITVGGTRNLPTIETTIKVSEARLDLETAEAIAPLEATLNARLDAESLNASVTAEMKDTLTVNAQGNLPLLVQLKPVKYELPPTAPLSGSVEYTIFSAPLLLALGVVEHQLEATLTGKFTASGSMENLQASGDAYIQDGRYTNALAGTRLDNLNLHIAADGASLRLEQCTANAGKDGSINANGELQLQASQQFPFSIKTEFNNAEFAQLSYLNGRVNGALDIQGDLSGAAVGGNLVIGPVYASMPDQLPVSEPTVLNVVEVKDGEIVEKETAVSGKPLPKVKLDIQCDIPSRVYVRAPILDSEWGGKLHIGGLLTDPKIEGRIAVLRGYLDFLGRRFQLRDSAFSFPGGAPTDLWLDMRAVAETTTLSSQLRLSGKLSEVKLELTSEPPLPQDEVLAQVLFGRDLSRISPVQAIQLARVAAMFNKGLAGIQFFSGTVGLPGIDRIDIRTGERADETVVGLGKYLTDSVYVEVEQGTTTDSGKVSVEVEVTPNISVKGDVDAKERSGVGLFWNRDY